MLTAGSWDDTLDFGFFLDDLVTTTPAGALQVPRGDRLVLHVRDANGHPVAGQCTLANGTVVTAL